MCVLLWLGTTGNRKRGNLQIYIPIWLYIHLTFVALHTTIKSKYTVEEGTKTIWLGIVKNDKKSFKTAAYDEYFLNDRHKLMRLLHLQIYNNTSVSPELIVV